MDSLFSTSGNVSVTAAMQQLYQKGRYRQAFDLGVRELGQLTGWPEPEQRVMASRILGNLGLVRPAQALTCHLWRRHPHLPYVTSHFISLTLRRKGPLKALQLIEEMEHDPRLTDEERLYVTLEKVEVFNAYRDFGAAEQLLASIPPEQRQRWVAMAEAETERAQDNYAAAGAIIDRLRTQEPEFLSARMVKARLLQLDHNLEGACALLGEIWPQVESWWLGRGLFDVCLELRRYAEAETILQQLVQLPPWQDKDLAAQVKAMWADLLCAQKLYERALPYLEARHFFQRQVADAIRNNAQGERRVLDVPFVRQKHMTCAPASMAAVTSYWHAGVPQEEIIEAICYGGTQSDDERRWGVANGWFAREFDLDLPTLKSLIDLGVPVLLATVEPGSAHLQIIVGYDLAMGTYLLRDPYHPRLREMLIEESHRYYASNGPRCLLLMPLDQAASVAAVPLQNAELYDRLYELNLALKNNRRDQAGAALEQATALAPGHRLALECQRALAFYDRDDQTLLTVTEALLKHFPDDINLQLGKLNYLQELGSSAQALTYLENLTEQPNCHLLLLARLAEILRRDQRQAARTDKLLRHLLRWRPQHAPTLYSYAGVLWDQGRRGEACRLYRFVACLEDTASHYAESYFRAARYLRETETALAFLTERWEKFGRRSNGPAISLFNALDALDRTEAALQLLEQAIAWRPEDGELLLFSAQRYLWAGQHQRASALLARARGNCNQVRFHEVAAAIAQYQLDQQAAVAAYQEVLRLEPLNRQANRSLMRLYTEQDANALAIAHVDRQLERFPGNAMLLRIKYEWLEEAEKDALAATLADYIQHHPQDGWGYRTRVYLMLGLGRNAEALADAREAVAIDGTEWTNLGTLGDALLADKQMPAARETFRQAIRLSCDYGYAFSRLLACSTDPHEQRADIDFIHRELLAQVSYGDGILDFANIAARWLEQDKLLEFLRFAVEVRPDLWQSWIALAIAQRDQGRNLDSLATLQAACEKFPLLPRVHYEHGETLHMLHRDPEAMTALQQALDLSPGWVKASNRLSELLEKRGDFTAAIELQKTTVKHSPLSATPYGFLADLYLRTGARDLAITHLTQAIERDPGYHWAWRTLYRLRRADGDAVSVIEQLRQHIAQFPNRADLLEIFADLEERPEPVIAALSDYLERRPHHLGLSEKLVKTLADSEAYDQAFAFVRLPRWGAHAPVEIQGLEAWLYAQQGNHARAITRMREVAAINPNYYEAWRLLSTWGEKAQDQDLVREAIEHCVRLHPNDAAVLCFAAEKLQGAQGDKQRITALLQHAFELDVTDQYIALTYIDQLLDQGEKYAAGEALQKLDPHSDDNFVALRKLRVELQFGDRERALGRFRELLRDTANGATLLPAAWRYLEEAGLQVVAAEAIEDLRRDGVTLHEMAGCDLAEYHLRTLKLKELALRLRNMTFDSPFEQRYLSTYLGHLCDNKKDVPPSLEPYLSAHWVKHTRTLSLAARLKYNIGREKAALKLFQGLEQRADAEAWALYFYSICQRQAGTWARGVELMQEAMQRPAGNYQQDIRVWHSFDRLVEGRDVDLEFLDHLVEENLAPLTQSILALVRALRPLQSGDSVAVFARLSSELRRCQAVFHGFKANSVAKRAQRKARSLVTARLPAMSFHRRCFWRWRLGNHF